ncbi:hypothetical protein ACI2KO_15015 [Pseudomonas piscis]|uniref:hypothetical protein n=1 Tax=Pseudomonas piscis TaxID=2614538 RepID=UPI00384BA08B
MQTARSYPVAPIPRAPRSQAANGHGPAIPHPCESVARPGARPAPAWLQVQRCAVLERRRGSQYSPRPRNSEVKKSPDEKPDLKANLSRPRQVSRRRNQSTRTLCRLYRYSRAMVLSLFSALPQQPLKAAELSDRTVFEAKKKGATPERQIKKNIETPTLGATE